MSDASEHGTRWRCRLAMPFLVVIASSMACVPGVRAEPRGTEGGAIVTVRPTTVYFLEGDSLCRGRRIQAATVLPHTTVETLSHELTRTYWPVSTRQDASGRLMGFIPRNDAFDLTAMRTRVLEAVPGFPNTEELARDSHVPALIRLSDPMIIKAWREVAPILAWNETRPQDERSPEPHFAMAQIWTAAGNHTDALASFMAAASLVRRRDDGDLLAHAHYFTTLEAALEREVVQPGEPVIRDAWEYWGLGMGAIRAGRLDDSILHFTDATQLDPSQPLFWYCRALAYRALRLNDRAERDARIGAQAEAKWRSYGGSWRRSSVDRRLEWFQGADRIWLESIRIGEAVAWGRR